MGSKWAVILFTLAALGELVMTNSQRRRAPAPALSSAHHDGGALAERAHLAAGHLLVGRGVGRSRRVAGAARIQGASGAGPVLAWADSHRIRKI